MGESTMGVLVRAVSGGYGMNIQCATCINHDLMYQVDETDHHVVNRVTGAIQHWARIFQCPNYWPAHQYGGRRGQ